MPVATEHPCLDSMYSRRTLKQRTTWDKNIQVCFLWFIYCMLHELTKILIQNILSLEHFQNRLTRSAGMMHGTKSGRYLFVVIATEIPLSWRRFCGFTRGLRFLSWAGKCFSFRSCLRRVSQILTPDWNSWFLCSRLFVAPPRRESSDYSNAGSHPAGKSQASLQMLSEFSAN